MEQQKVKDPIVEEAASRYPTTDPRKDMFHDNFNQYERRSAFIDGVDYWKAEIAKKQPATVEGNVITVDALVQMAMEQCDSRSNSHGVRLFMFNENGLKSVMEQVLQAINWNNQSNK